MLVAIILVAAVVLLSTVLRKAQSADTVQASETCAPKPCAAPNGFEAHLGAIAVQAGQVTLQVTFINHSTPEFGSVSYHHTNPQDFLLKGPDGVEHKPVFSLECPNWDEPDIEQGASAGPDKLCFEAPPGALQGTAVIWDPDLGLFSTPVTIPLVL